MKKSADAATKAGVLIAIDWENIRRGAQMYQQSVTPRALCDALKTVGEIFGEVRGGKVFGDWSLRREDAAAFTLAGIEPYNAPRTMAGKDRTDPSILLEVYDWVRDREDCPWILLGSGDSDYQALVDRAKSNDRRIIICAFSQSVARDMLAVAPLFPLEAELGFRLPEHGAIAGGDGLHTSTQDALQIFVRQIDRLEGSMNFVGYNKLCTQWMLDWGIASTEYECYRLIDQWLYDEVIERHDVANPNNPAYPTSAIRLIRSNETVRDLLGFNRPAATVANPVATRI
jgi:hypothetical protein